MQEIDWLIALDIIKTAQTKWESLIELVRRERRNLTLPSWSTKVECIDSMGLVTNIMHWQMYQPILAKLWFSTLQDKSRRRQV